MDETELKKMVGLAGLKEYSSFEDVPCNLRKRIRVSCFPPTPEEASKFHLERCMRVLPQDMDTGGFFVALLKKVAPMNNRARKRFQSLAEELQENEAEGGGQDEEPKVKKVKIDPEDSADVSMEEDIDVKENMEGESEIDKAPGNASDMKDVDESENDKPAEKEAGGDGVLAGEKDSVKQSFRTGKDGKKHESLARDDFIPVPKNLLEPIKKFYGLSSDTFDEGNYMIRAGGDAKVLYFICKTVHSLIDRGIQQRLSVISSGLKGFVRNNKECEVGYRVAQDGVHFVAPHMTKRKIAADIEDFKKCLEMGTLPIKDFSDEFAENVKPLVMGSFVVHLKGYEDDYIKKLVIVMWRCRGDAVNVLVNQGELDGMKSKIRSVLHEDEPKAEAKPPPAEEEES
jgi:hypothetical protein